MSLVDYLVLMCALSLVAIDAFTTSGVPPAGRTALGATVVSTRPLFQSRLVNLCMGLVTHYSQIFGTVIVFYTVDVVNNFVATQRTAKRLLRDQAMFKHMLTVTGRQDNVTRYVVTLATAPMGITLADSAFSRTSARAIPTTATEYFARFDVKCRAAVETLTFGAKVEGGIIGVHIGPPSGVPCLGRVQPLRGFIMPQLYHADTKNRGGYDDTFGL